MREEGLMPQPRHELLMAYLSAAAVVAHILEAALPGLGPWFKPGLANTFTLVAFFQLGWKAAAGVAMIRVLAGSLALGTFFSPTFFLSLSGATGAVLTLGMIHLLPCKVYLPTHPSQSRNEPQDTPSGLGPVGVSLLSAMVHMLFQVLVAWLLIIGHSSIFLALPWFLVGSWLTGIFNGLLAFLILERLARFQMLAKIR